MANFPQTIIVRHRRENLKKCSLRGLERRSDLHFFRYPGCQLPDLSNYFLLSVEGPLLEKGETRGMLLLDGTWKLAATIEKNLSMPPERRSLPPLQTAYPRRQDEERGLATVEALFAAYLILGYPTEGLLDNYYWKADFIQNNHAWFHSILPNPKADL